MLILFLIAIAVIIVLVVFMFFILKGTVKKINTQTKMYLVDKLQEYDYLIDQKEEKLNQLNLEIKEKEIKKEEQETSTLGNNYEFDYNIINLLNKTQYQDKNIFELNKKIDEKFRIDSVALLNQFLTNIKEDGTYQFCQTLRGKFQSKEIYQLKVMDSEAQEEYLKKFLTADEYQIYLLYKKLNKTFDIDSFLDYLNELVDLNNPNIFVYVGNHDENYDYLSKYIKTIYSKDIYKGIKIMYRNKIYDYSLNERNV